MDEGWFPSFRKDKATLTQFRLGDKSPSLRIPLPSTGEGLVGKRPIADNQAAWEAQGMFGSIIFLVAAASTIIGDLDPFERVTVQEAAKRVSKCGLGLVIVNKDDRQRAVILTAANPPPLNDDQLACADGAASFYVLKLPAETQKRYDAIRKARLTASLVANARRWLSEHGLLARLPAYAPGVTDAVIFTQQIEDLCGPLAKGAFQSSYGPHVISPEWSDDNEKRGRKGVEASQCLTNATIATRYDYSIILKDRSAELKKAAH